MQLTARVSRLLFFYKVSASLASVKGLGSPTATDFLAVKKEIELCAILFDNWIWATAR